VNTAGGSPVRNARVELRGRDGELLMVVTNTFGQFRFDSVEVGRSYVLSAAKKGLTFSTPRLIVLTDDITDADLTADP
jgi:hypothetical protein